MTLLLSLIFSLPHSPEALARSQRAFDFEGQKKTLEWNAEGKGWVSAGCTSPAACEALRMRDLVGAGMVSLRPHELKGGKNPGSVLCAKLSGTVVFAIPEDGGGRTSFCKAGDGSIIPNTFLNLAWEGRTP